MDLTKKNPSLVLLLSIIAVVIAVLYLGDLIPYSLVDDGACVGVWSKPGQSCNEFCASLKQSCVTGYNTVGSNVFVGQSCSSDSNLSCVIKVGGVSVCCLCSSIIRDEGEGASAIYHFDEGAGNLVIDSSNNNNHASLIGRYSWWGQPWVTGKVGPYALKIPIYNGAYLQCGTSMLFPEDIVFESWIRTTNKKQLQWIIGRSIGYQDIPIWAFMLKDGCPAFFRGSEIPVANSDVDISDGFFHHVAFVLTDTSMKLYVDGLVKDDVTSYTLDDIDQVTTCTGPCRANAYLTIGGRYRLGGTDVDFDGVIDEVKLFNLSLSDEKMWQRFIQHNDTYASPPPDNVVYALVTKTEYILTGVYSTEDISIPVKLLYGNNQPASYVLVTALIDSQSVVGTTDIGGNLNILFNSMPVGEYPLHISFTNPADGSQASSDSLITVSLSDIEIEINKDRFSLFESSMISVPISVKHSTANIPLPHAPIIVVFNNIVLDGATDSSGLFTASFVDATPGIYVLTASVTHPITGLISSVEKTVEVVALDASIHVLSNKVSVCRGSPVPVLVEVVRTDGVAVVGNIVHGTLSINGVVESTASAATNNVGEAVLNFMDIDTPGVYMAEVVATHPLTNQNIVGEMYVTVDVLPVYSVDFVSAPIVYSGKLINIGVTIRDEYQNIVDVEDLIASVSVANQVYTSVVSKKGYGLFDISLNNLPEGDLLLIVTLPSGELFTFNAQVKLPKIRAYINIPIESDEGIKSVEVQVYDANNQRIEVDDIRLVVQTPSNRTDSLILERATLGIFGGRYTFDEKGRYVITYYVDKAGYETYTESIYTDVSPEGKVTPVISYAIYAVYILAAMMLIIIVYTIYGMVRKK